MCARSVERVLELRDLAPRPGELDVPIVGEALHRERRRLLGAERLDLDRELLRDIDRLGLHRFELLRVCRLSAPARRSGQGSAGVSQGIARTAGETTVRRECGRARGEL